MSADQATAAAAEASNNEAAENAAEGDKGTEGGETGGTTPEEVAAVLKSSGMDVKVGEPKAEEKEGGEADGADKGTAGDEGDSDGSADAGDENDRSDGQNAEEEVSKNESSKKGDAQKSVSGSDDVKEFTLEVEDASGETHKIEKIEDLPEDFEPKNNRQIMQILKDLSTLETDKAKYEADQAEDAKQAETATAVENTLKGWDEERKELDITDDKRYEEVMKYMSTENDKRQEAGKPMIRTVEHALLGLEKQEAKTAADDKAKADKETARKNGGLVGGSSAPASSAAPVYKAGTARNANEAIRAMGLI